MEGDKSSCQAIDGRVEGSSDRKACRTPHHKFVCWMASTKAGSSSRALRLALEREKSRWKPCCKRSSSRDESRDRSPRNALVIITAKLPDDR